jgi:hypothetical protein
MSGIEAIRALGADLLVARGHLSGLKTIANATRSNAGSFDAGAVKIRSGALHMLDQVIPTFERAAGQEAQVVIGPGVNHAIDALQNLQMARRSLEAGQGLRAKDITNADAIAGSLLKRLLV